MADLASASRFQRNIGGSLLAAFLVVIGLAAALGLVALSQMREINRVAIDVAGNHLPSLLLIDEIGQLADEFRLLQIQHELSFSPEDLGPIDAQMDLTGEEIDARFATLAAADANHGDQLLLDAAQSAWVNYRATSESLRVSVAGDRGAGDVAATIAETAGLFDVLKSALNQWRQADEAAALAELAEARSTFRSAQIFVAAVLAGVIATSVAIAVWIGRLVARFRRRSDSALDVAGVEAERARIFARLSDRLAFAIDEADLVRAAIVTLQRLLPTPRGDLLLLNPSQDRLIVAGAWGHDTPEIGSPVPVDRPGLCPGVRRGTVYGSGDVGDELAVRCLAHPVEHGSLLCVPMLAMGEVVGVIHLEQPERNAFDAASQQLVSRAAEQTALALANARLMRKMEGQAMTDPLTGLHNARFLDRLFDHELTIAERDRRPVGVILLDLDHFKRFNDAHGHPAGDEALRAFAKAVRGAVRDSDAVARYGGEEFVVVLRDTDLRTASVVAEKIRQAIEQLVVEIGPGRFARVTASLGVASSAAHGTDRMTLLRIADQALYRAKEQGRNKVVAADGTFAVSTVDGEAERDEALSGESGDVVLLAQTDPRHDATEVVTGHMTGNGVARPGRAKRGHPERPPTTGMPS